MSRNFPRIPFSSNLFRSQQNTDNTLWSLFVHPHVVIGSRKQNKGVNYHASRDQTVGGYCCTCRTSSYRFRCHRNLDTYPFKKTMQILSLTPPPTYAGLFELESRAPSPGWASFGSWGSRCTPQSAIRIIIIEASDRDWWHWSWRHPSSSYYHPAAPAASKSDSENASATVCQPGTFALLSLSQAAAAHLACRCCHGAAAADVITGYHACHPSDNA